jgi:hypothetical protein
MVVVVGVVSSHAVSSWDGGTARHHGAGSPRAARPLLANDLDLLACSKADLASNQKFNLDAGQPLDL